MFEDNVYLKDTKLGQGFKKAYLCAQVWKNAAAEHSKEDIRIPKHRVRSTPICFGFSGSGKSYIAGGISRKCSPEFHTSKTTLNISQLIRQGVDASTSSPAYTNSNRSNREALLRKTICSCVSLKRIADRRCLVKRMALEESTLQGDEGGALGGHRPSKGVQRILRPYE